MNFRRTWLRRIIRYAFEVIGVDASRQRSIFARCGEDRWMTPRCYEEQQLEVVSWPDRSDTISISNRV